MDWKWVMDHAQEEWRVVTEAPGMVVVAALVIGAILFGVFTWAYQSVVAQKDAAISGQQTTITNLNSTISNLRSEIVDLNAKLAAKPAQPQDQAAFERQNNPDGIFQLGKLVGRGQGAQEDRGYSVV